MSEIAKIQGYDIRDKKLADATSASSVASTDAIRMKTTTGDEVYIDRDSFVGAIASVFKANNSSDVTSLFGELTANNESSPCSINMSNLASVLSAALNSAHVKTAYKNDAITIRYFCIIGVCWHRNDPSLAVGNLYLKIGTKLIELYKGTTDVGITVNDVSTITFTSGQSSPTISYFIYPDIS